MFITRAEKEAIFIKIERLNIQVADLQSELLRLRDGEKHQRKPIIRTPEAPYGLKKDGAPRKRPGRPQPIMEVGAA